MIRRNPKIFFITFLVLLTFYFFCLPKPLFTDSTCMVLEDRNGKLLGARIAADEQWRFPYSENVPDKFKEAITTFEDKRFYYHPGFDPIGFIRAMGQNIRNGEIVSGGSTLSMQVIRMARKGKARSVKEKIIEAILATRLEIRYSKDEILALYASNAPFGGNVVGLDAASWRYYGKKADLISWSEAATLAVLPNSPALIHPGRNRQALLDKRNRLIDRLLENEIIDQLTCDLAKEEPLPDKPYPLPRNAPHLLDRAYLEHFYKKKNTITRLRSTVDAALQKKISPIINRHHEQLSANGIHNLAAIILEVETGDVLAYVGNVPNAGKEHGEAVDIITAPRSTGSILKPLLTTFVMQEGLKLPNSLLSDVPTQMRGYRPENYHQKFDGVIPMNRALSRSLNVPFVRLLQEYGLEKFHKNLKKSGLNSIRFPAVHYGLPLVLGGAESSLWEISGVYASMGRTLSHFYPTDGRYLPNDLRAPNYVLKNHPAIQEQAIEKEPILFSAGAVWHTFEAMLQLERPNSQGAWRNFDSSRKIAWKTGTSFGFRDAWAVGIDSEYVVGVWVGNADGEGRPGLVGVQAAAPVLFDLFDLLPTTNEWFDMPYDDMIQIPVCTKSGYRALAECEADSIWVQQNGVEANACPYHKRIHLDASEQFRVNSSCEPIDQIVHTAYFNLPPLEEYYYKGKDPSYRLLPPYREDCASHEYDADNPIQLIYPRYKSQIYVPIELDGSESKTVFRVAHRQAEKTIYWHIDNTYIGSTAAFHEMELNPTAGKHQLTLVDEDGFRVEQFFEIVGR